MTNGWGERLGLAAVAAAALVGLTGAGQLAGAYRPSARADTSGGEAAAPLVITTEAEFQAAVAANGISAAFTQYGVPEGVVFTPDASVVGRAFTQPTVGALQWRPEAVAVASGGDLAASTGPGRFTAQGGAISTSWYLTIWRRQGAGFRFALDGGVQTDGDYLNAAPTPYDIIVARGRPGLSFNLQDLEREYAGDAARDARRTALDRLDETHGRLLRDGARAAVGRAQATTLLAAGPSAVQLTYRDGSVSNTGDLAYAWGEATWTDGAGAAQRGFYVHVWLRDGRDWHTVMDMLAKRREPAPTPPPAAPADPAAAAPPAAATAPAATPAPAMPAGEGTIPVPSAPPAEAPAPPATPPTPSR